MVKNHKTGNIYFLSSIIPVLIVILVFMLKRIFPFGNNNLLISDLETQYFPFFVMLRDQLIHLNFNSYSFFLSIGDNVLPIYTYYLMNPLNLLVIFFKIPYIPLLINIIILVKIALIGFSMSFFLKKMFKKTNIMLIISSVSYSLCGFVAMYFYDLMWLDALVLLPFVTLGISKLFKEDKWGVYVISLTLSIILNYYMGYMICLYSVFYYLYLNLLDKPINEKWVIYIKRRFNNISIFIFNSLIVGFISSIILIPTFVSMLSTSKRDLNLISLVPYPRFSPAALIGFGVGATNFSGRLFHNPSFFTGSIFLIGIFVFWFSPLISKREKKASFFLLGILFLSLWITSFNTVWHMFQQPAGFVYRNVYFFSFVLIVFTYEAWLRNCFFNKQVVIKAGLASSFLIFIGYIFANIQKSLNENYFKTPTQYMVSNFNGFLSIFFIILTIYLIIHNKNKNKLLILLIICIEMGTNLFLSLEGSPYGNQKKFEKSYYTSNRIIKKTKGKQNFWRSDVDNKVYAHSFEQSYHQYNDSLIFKYFGVSGYSSTLNFNTTMVLSNLGLFSRNPRRISVIGSSEVTNYLLGLKNKLVISKRNGYTINTNKNNLQLGYMVNNKVNNIKFISNDVFGNLDKFLQNESGYTNTNFFKKANIINVQIKKSKYKNLENHKIQGYHYKFDVISKTYGPQYMYIPNVKMSDVLVKVNYKPISSRYNTLGTELIPIGHAKLNQKFYVEIFMNHKLNMKLNNYFRGLKEDKFYSFVNKTKNHKLIITSPGVIKSNLNSFTGKIKVNKEQETLLLSLPYDKGWHISENGTQLPTEKVSEGLMGVKLKSGKHKLNFSYATPGFKLGIRFFIIGIFMLGIEFYLDKKKQ